MLKHIYKIPVAFSLEDCTNFLGNIEEKLSAI